MTANGSSTDEAAPTSLVYLDDSPLSLRVVADGAAAFGATVETFSDPALLLERMKQSPAVLAALLDFDLGSSVNGIAVAQALRAIDLSLRIAFFTATSKTSDREALAAIGTVFDKATQLDAAVRWIAHGGQ